MAPDVGREAEYIRERAKKDLLGLLEGVSLHSLYHLRGTLNCF